MNYEDMSDFEINEQVARLRFDVFAACHDGSRKNGSVRASGAEFDPCNNPSDAWPVILKYGISINFDGIDWEADTSWMGSESSNRSYNNIEKNAGKPLRAAMICFLNMKDAEK